MFKRMREDVRAVQQRDPAARSALEVALLYPGLHAVWGHRLAHWFWRHHLKFLGRGISQLVRWFTGVEYIPARELALVFSLIMAWAW